MVGAEVRLLKGYVKYGEDGYKKFEVQVEVFGNLSLVEPNLLGEYLVTSSTADSAIGNFNYQFHSGQLVGTAPGNPNEIYIQDRKPLGIV